MHRTRSSLDLRTGNNLMTCLIPNNSWERHVEPRLKPSIKMMLLCWPRSMVSSNRHMSNGPNLTKKWRIIWVSLVAEPMPPTSYFATTQRAPQWRDWQRGHPTQESPHFHCPSHGSQSPEILDQGEGSPLMDRAVPPQVQSSHFHPRPAHQNEALGLLNKNPGPPFPPLHSVTYASPDYLTPPSYFWSNLTPKEVVFRFIYLFVSTSLKQILKEFHDVFCPFFPSVYLVPILFCNGILNLAGNEGWLFPIECLLKFLSRQCWVTTGCSLP